MFLVSFGGGGVDSMLYGYIPQRLLALYRTRPDIPVLYLRDALQDLENTTARLERMMRRMHMRLDAIAPAGDVGFH